MLTASQLKSLCPMDTAAAMSLCIALNSAMHEYGIGRTAHVAAFLAQIAHESANFKYRREIWGNTEAQNRYDVRVDLGNTPERDGDGKRYLGRGFIQITGKTNYKRCGEALGLDLINHPELLEKTSYAVLSAAWFWAWSGCQDLAKQLNGTGDVADLAAFDRITKRINGGYNGRIDRRVKYLKALKILRAAPLARVEPTTTPSAPVKETTPETPARATAQPAVQSADAEGKSKFSLKDLSKKYLRHTPHDSVKNIFLVVSARAGASTAFLWNLGVSGKVLMLLLVLAIVAPAVWAIYVYHGRIWQWITEIFEGVTGE